MPFVPNTLRLIRRWFRIFNVGSPYNVPAGHYANMDKLIEFYREKANKEEEVKMQKLKERQQ